jgi:transcriptional regulator with XRE-family HTH domain
LVAARCPERATARPGIDRGTLSKLENDENPNVTMNTLMRYAQAVGKTVLVQLEDAPAGSAGNASPHGAGVGNRSS